jgi:hypothetical protein
MSKQTAVKTIFEKFNLMSDADFKSWMLNNHDELETMEKEQIIDAAYEFMGTNFDPNKGRAELYYKGTYGGDK